MSSVETLRYWPRRIKEKEDLPQGIALKDEWSKDIVNSYSIFFPDFSSNAENPTGAILSLEGENYILYNGDNRFEIDNASLLWLEYGETLLDGRLIFQSTNRRFRINYNISQEKLVRPFIHSFIPRREMVIRENKQRLSFLFQENMKFYSYSSALPIGMNEEFRYLYQTPRLILKKRKRWGLTRPQYQTAFLLIGTEQGLFIIREMRSYSWKQEDYGARIRFIPRRNIKGIDCIGEKHLRIQLHNNFHMELSLSNENLDQAHLFCL